MLKINNRFGAKLATFNPPIKKGFFSQSPGNCAGCSNSSPANCSGSQN